MAKPILISGIQPTGPLHLGNYLGALKNFVDLQNSSKYECYFFIADYHSLTENFNPEEKPAQILNLAKEYLAAGLDPQKSTIFIQSYVPQVTELAWILSTLTPFGELSRMTQFKEKGSSQAITNVGLFTYPILMAADILLYNAEFVPIGNDQLQHLEFTRTLIRKLNSKFGTTLKEPKPLLTKIPRLMSLQNSEKKMSKSEPNGCLFLGDSPEIIKDKIKKAVTDSGSEIKFDERTKPAISNLIQIYSAFKEETTDDTEDRFKGKTYTQFKVALSELLISMLQDFRTKKDQLTDKEVKDMLSIGGKIATKAASQRMPQIKAKIGLSLTTSTDEL
jgi:tryptophanyl-tRNA synthetase